MEKETKLGKQIKEFFTARIKQNYKRKKVF